MQVRKTVEYIEEAAAEDAALTYSSATVTRVTPLDMGDRVCVDLCSKMTPGEGMLVGNFCRTLFLVHSEVRPHVCACRASKRGPSVLPERPACGHC